MILRVLAALGSNAPPVLAAALGLAGLLALAAPGAARTLVYCSEGSPENFYPGINATLTSFDASAVPIYNRLIEFERGGVRPVPGLAASWDISADGRAYTFHLRPGVRFQTTRNFQPTRDFNADDVIFSFERQWKPDNPYFKVTSDNHGYFVAMAFPSLLKAIEKVDDQTVRFMLDAPEAPFLADLAMDFASIISKEYADKMMKAGTPELVDQEPVGTGPFQLESYQKDAVIRYKAHPRYWEGKAEIDALVYSITPDASVRYAKLRANECKIAPYPNPADIPAMKNDPALKVLEQPGLNIGYVAFNTTRKPLDDKRVRQALNLAINKKAIIDAVYRGVAIPAKNPIPPSMWSYNDAVEDYPYDLARARKLLAEAGYPDGFETDLWALPIQRPYNPNGRRMAELMQADLAKLGVRATIVTYEWGEYRKRLQQGAYMMAELGWIADNGDPDNFLYTLLGCDEGRPRGGNSGGWCNPQFDALVVAAKRTADQAKRTELYQRAQAIFKEEAPWVTVAHGIQVEAIRAEVAGYRLSPFGRHDFYGVGFK
jgi:dipeptide transport system substrate-binding protein